MPEFPAIDYGVEAISPWSHYSVGGMLLVTPVSSSPTSTAWPSANRAIFIPFRLRQLTTITQIVVGCGATGGNNLDAGVYDVFGNLIVSSGSTARVASSEVPLNITDTKLGRGTYYMSLAADSTSNMIGVTPTNLNLMKLCGIKEMASAFPLPSTATFATVSSAFVPSIALYRTSL